MHEALLYLGSGGVGKTTVAAASAVAAAQEGARVVVLTIDPARRLAETLDLDGAGDEARLVAGPWPGELWAAQRQPSATLAEVLHRHGRPGQADRILSNPTFQAVTHATPGISEYMAVERFHQLHTDARFDVVVLDTPPSRHAIEFLDSPQRLCRFVDNRLYRTVLAPRSGVLRSASSAGRLALRAVARLVGMELVDNVMRLFADLDGLDQGFRDRAAEIGELLTSPRCRYRLVTTARPETVAEATWIGRSLIDRGLTVDAVVANRVAPSFARPERAGRGGGTRSRVPTPLAANLAELSALAEREAELVGGLADALGRPPVVRVQERARMARGRDALVGLAAELAAATPPRPPARTPLPPPTR
ncbi:MAG: ArsA-related P-loop ATPase [Acidimicrobiales bacterium]